MGDTIKFITDSLSKFPKKDLLKVIVDVNALENFSSDDQKYSIDNCKKPMNEEEFEDFLSKLFIDKRFVI